MSTEDWFSGLLQKALEAERLGKFDLAREALREVAGSDSPLALGAQIRLGRLLAVGTARHYDEAEAVLNQARTTAERTESPRQAAQAVHLLALVQRHRGHYAEAIELLDKSPVIKHAGSPGIEAGQWYHCRGLVESDQGKLSVAERLFFRAHAAYAELHFEPGIAEVCDSLSNVLLKLGKTHVALKFAQRSLELKRKQGDRFGQAITLGTIGRIYTLQARYDEAAAAFQQDLEIATELNDVRGMGIMLNSLGENALLQKEAAAALDYHQRSLATDDKGFNAAYAELGLACAHLERNEIDKAQAAADRLATVLTGLPSVQGLDHELTGVRGAIARHRGQSAAETLLLAAIAGLKEANQAIDTIPWLYELRDWYHSQGRAAEAVKVMSAAIDLLSQLGSERGVADVEEWLRTVDAPGLTRLALERHFPEHLIDGILSGQLKRPETRRQEVAVLFSDIRDYTSMAEGMQPEEVVTLLNQWFAEASRAIGRHGGVIDKFIGDAVMALFGVPEPRDDATADAVRAALELRDTLAAMNLEQQALGGRTLQVGVGVDVGDVVVGFIGSHLRQSYTVIGDPVNTAARLEAATRKHPGCDILISQAAQERQEKYAVAETMFLGHEQLRGRQAVTAIYQVRGHRGSAD